MQAEADNDDSTVNNDGKTMTAPAELMDGVPESARETGRRVGMESETSKRSASYFLTNHEPAAVLTLPEFADKIEVMDIRVALDKYPLLKDRYLWKLLSPERDSFTKSVSDSLGGGYFIRIARNAKVDLPIQSCLMMSKDGMEQHVHNLIIVEPGAEAQIISGCTVHEGVTNATHIGVSEFFIGEGAKLTFSMIHDWNSSITVRPRTSARVEAGGLFVSNYACLNPVKDIQMYPSVECAGDGATARFNSILYSDNKSLIDAGSKISLNAPNTRGEIIARAIAKGGSKIISRGFLEANKVPAKAHLECKGIILGESTIHAIPELVGRMEGVELSHEAAVGKIADKEITYLMTRGLSEEEAVSVIVRGFLDVSIFGLPKELAERIESLVATVAGGL